jgi:hypothetical protein
VARIRDFAGTAFPSATTALTLDMPEHEAGDWLYALLNRDGTGGTFTPPAGWLLVRQRNTAGSSNAAFAKYAASSSETAAFTHTSETGNGVVVAVRDGDVQKDSGTITLGVNSGTGVWTRSAGDFSADGFVVGMAVFVSGMTTAANNGTRILTAVGTTTFTTATTGLTTESGSGDERVVSLGVGQIAESSADDSTNPIAGTGITPLFTDSLLLHFLGGDAMLGPLVLPPWISLYGADAVQGGICVSYSVEPTTSAVTAPNHWAGTPDDARGIMLEVLAGPNDTQVPYIPLDTVPATQLTALVRVDAPDGGTHILAGAIAITSVAGKTVSGVTSTAVADAGINVFRSVMAGAGVSSTTNLNHSEFNLTATFDATVGKGIIFGTYFYLTARDYFDQGTAVQGGNYILLGSDTTNWRAWVVGGYKVKDSLADARNNYAIQVDVADTEYAAAGTPDFSVLDYMAWGSAGVRGAPAIRWSSMFLLGTVVLAGGTAANPFGFDDLVYVVNNGCGVLPILQQQGQAATVWTALQFGGNETIGIRCSLNTFQMPERANEVSLCAFHVEPDHIGYEFYGLDADDFFAFPDCVFTSPSSYYWRFHASHDADAVLDFSGAKVVNATVTLRATVLLDSISFIGCAEVVTNAATLTNSTFQDCRDGAGSGAVLFASVAQGDAVVGAAFLNNNDGDLGHSIRITATGTYTFDHTFSGGGPPHFGFHTQTDVDAAADEVDHTAHGFTTGDAVYYQDQGGSDTMGLTDGNLYYVRAVTADSLAFYTTKANAVADTSRVGLSDGAAGQTHYIYSAKADVFVDVAGAVTIDVTGSGDTPSVRVRDGGSVTVNVSVLVQITVLDLNNDPIQDVRVSMYRVSDGLEILNEDTNASGIADSTFSGTTPANIKWRCRKGSAADSPKYITRSGVGVITSSGFDLLVTMDENPNNNA